MEITYYADIMFLINFSMDFFLLCLLRMILKLKGSKRRLAAGSAAGAVFTVIFTYFWLRIILMGQMSSGLLFFLWLSAVLGISSLMLLFSFSFKSIHEFLKAEAGLLFGAALTEGLLEGGMTALWYGKGGNFSVLKIPAAAFFLAGACKAAKVLWKVMDRSAWEQKFCYQVTLFYRGRQVEAKGFLDTGNHLADPLSGCPVHVADRKLLEAVCPVVEKVRMIPYRTIEGGGMMMPAVFLDRMEAVQEKQRLVYEQPLVAASPDRLQIKNGCRILLHE